MSLLQSSRKSAGSLWIIQIDYETGGTSTHFGKYQLICRIYDSWYGLSAPEHSESFSST